MRTSFVITTLLMLVGCDDTPGQWSAIVYADGHDRSHYQTTRGFKSLAMCRRAASESIAALPDPQKADYRCGFQCEPDPAAPGRNACQEIKK
jgi:hypothetical protein